MRDDESAAPDLDQGRRCRVGDVSGCAVCSSSSVFFVPLTGLLLDAVAALGFLLACPVFSSSSFAILSNSSSSSSDPLGSWGSWLPAREQAAESVAERMPRRRSSMRRLPALFTSRRSSLETSVWAAKWLTRERVMRSEEGDAGLRGLVKSMEMRMVS